MLNIDELVPGEIYDVNGPKVYRGFGLNSDREVAEFRDLESGKPIFPQILSDFVTPVKKAGIDSQAGLEEAKKRIKITYQDGGVARPVSLGADPEFFLQALPNAPRPNEFIPAFEVLPEKSKDVDIFWDGFQAEFKAPVRGCIELFTSQVRFRMEKMLEKVQRNRIGVNNGWGRTAANLAIDIIPLSTVRIGARLLQEADDKHVALGCDPSDNIYGMHGKSVFDPRKLNYRFAGGHIHIGFKNQYVGPGAIGEIVRCMDMLAGIPGVIMSQGWDEPIRRQYYGLAGEYRMPEHGLEYRTLSNFWLKEPAMCHLFMGLVRGAFQWGMKGLRGLFDSSAGEVIEIINGNSVVGARKWLEKNEKMFKVFLRAAAIPDAEKTFDVMIGKVKYPAIMPVHCMWHMFEGGVVPQTWERKLMEL